VSYHSATDTACACPESSLTPPLRVYPHYDIVIWSQTHWSWLETKLVELGVIGGPRNYKVCFVADRTTMFPVRRLQSLLVGLFAGSADGGSDLLAEERTAIQA
jgi:hypothetical protein